MEEGVLFEFPEGAALVNTFVGNAFVMRYQKPERIAEGVTVDTGKNRKSVPIMVQALKTELQCNVCNAILFVAPYVKIVSEIVSSGRRGLRRDLRDARFTLAIDGEKVVPDGKVTDCLVDPDGNMPATAWPDLSRETALFTGFEYSVFDKHKLGMSWQYRPSGLPLGLFLPNASLVNIELRNLPAGHGEVKLEAGLVAAMYTTVEKEIGTEGRKTRLKEHVAIKKS